MLKNTLVFILIVLVHYFSFAQKISTLEIGQKAPFFYLDGADGKSYMLHDFDMADILVVIFTCNHCPTSQAYEERISKLVKKYSTQGVQIVAISPNYPDAIAPEELGYTEIGDSFEEMKIRAQYKKFNFPYLYDGTNQEASQEYGPKVTPHAFVFDKKRKLRYQGRIDNIENPYNAPEKNYISATIDSLLSGGMLTTETTKVFGCPVRWKSDTLWKEKVDNKWKKKNVKLEIIGTEGVNLLKNNYNDNMVLLYLWSLESSSSTGLFDDFIKTHRMYNGRFFEVITLSMDKVENKENVMSFLQEHEAATKNYLYNPEKPGKLSWVIDPTWSGEPPYCMLIAPESKLLKKWYGNIDLLEVRRYIIEEIGRYHAND